MGITTCRIPVIIHLELLSRCFFLSNRKSASWGICRETGSHGPFCSIFYDVLPFFLWWVSFHAYSKNYQRVRRLFLDVPRHRPQIVCWLVLLFQVQGGAPPVISWFIVPINYRYNPLITPSYWLIVTNLANELGHHLVPEVTLSESFDFLGSATCSMRIQRYELPIPY